MLDILSPVAGLVPAAGNKITSILSQYCGCYRGLKDSPIEAQHIDQRSSGMACVTVGD